MRITRRHFLETAGAWTAGLGGLHILLGCTPTGARDGDATTGFGRLVSDSNDVIDLPPGFTYQVLSPTGQRMDDGFHVPGAHDGMACFPGPDGLTLVVRNHEMTPNETGVGSPFGKRHERLGALPRELAFDLGADASAPCIGGTTTFIYDTTARRFVGEFLSLVGTIRNCAGGPTPWGSWISCEETTERKGDVASRDHGWCFEVPATREAKVAAPRPLVAMGRFNHEAVGVDPRSGIVYETEDRHDGLFYRFIPAKKGDLAAGGKLQALVAVEREKLDTRNWNVPKGGSRDVPEPQGALARGEPLAVRWIDMEDVESPKDDLRERGHARGAALFARGEGVWWGGESVYLTCTSGGPNQKGQVFRYTPGAHEGTEREAEAPGRIELFIEPNDEQRLDMGDNITVAPWGDLIICEDGPGEQLLVGVTPEGELYPFARNAGNDSEFAGAAFSPDGTTLFVNVQRPGFTLAITGPWQDAREAAKKRRLR